SRFDALCRPHSELAPIGCRRAVASGWDMSRNCDPSGTPEQCGVLMRNAYCSCAALSPAISALGKRDIEMFHSTYTPFAYYPELWSALIRGKETSACRFPAETGRGPGDGRAGKGGRSLRTGAHRLPARVMQMVGDDRHGRLDIARTDRFIERGMLAVVFGDALGRQHLVLHGVPLPVRAHSVDLPINPHHEGVAGRLGDEL